MNRKTFIQSFTTGIMSISTLAAFRNFTSALPEENFKMPVLFIGHGSPMNGIQDTEFSRRWTKMAGEIPTPKAVLVVSAHWFTRGTKITAMDAPPTIHDFGGFPDELFAVQYPAPGHPQLANETAELIKSTQVELDHDWGLDHGAWTIIRHMYPDASIPVLQLSIDYTKDGHRHYEIASELQALRKKGVLIIGSGNMVHNLRMVAWHKLDDPGYGYDWAISANELFKSLILSGDHKALANYSALGKEVQLAVPTPEHYLPLIYSLALQQKDDKIEFFNDQLVGGSLTMTSVKIG